MIFLSWNINITRTLYIDAKAFKLGQNSGLAKKYRKHSLRTFYCNKWTKSLYCEIIFFLLIQNPNIFVGKKRQWNIYNEQQKLEKNLNLSSNYKKSPKQLPYCEFHLSQKNVIYLELRYTIKAGPFTLPSRSICKFFGNTGALIYKNFNPSKCTVQPKPSLKIESVKKAFLFWYWQRLKNFFFRNKTFSR